MTAAELAPWASPAILLVLFAWFRMDVTAQIKRVETNLGGRIDEVNRNLGKRIDEVNRNLGERIDQVNSSLGKRIDEVNSRLDRTDQRLQGIDDRLRNLEVTVGRMSGKVDLLENFIMRGNDRDEEASPASAE